MRIVEPPKDNMALRLIQLFTVLILTQSAVKTLLGVTVHQGTKATIPCNVGISPKEEVLAVYWHKGNVTVDNLLIGREDGVLRGPGYDNGQFNIAEDSSLIVNKVTSNDGGTYACVVVVEGIGWLVNSTAVDIEPPTPNIDKCTFNYVGGDRSQNCTYIVADNKHDEVNITCFVLGDFPNINLYFQHQGGVISGTNGQSQVESLTITYVTVSAVPGSEPYKCVAKNPGSSNGERWSTILLLRQQPELEVTSNDTSVEGNSNEVNFCLLALRWTITCVCLLLLILFILLGVKKKWRSCLWNPITRKREIIADDIEERLTLPTVNGDDLSTHSGDDGIDMGIDTSIMKLGGTTRIWKCDPQDLESDSWTEVTRTKSQIESLHCYNNKSMLSTIHAGTLSYVRSLRLVNVRLDGIFHPTMTTDACTWNIETLAIDNRGAHVDKGSSKSLARFIRSLPKLCNLHLDCDSLQERFIFSEAANKQQMQRLWYSVRDPKAGEAHEMDNFSNALAQMKGLRTLGISVASVTADCLSACLKKLTNLQNLRICGEPMTSSEDESCDLLSEIAKMPSLQALYLLQPGNGLLNLPSDMKITTLILRDVNISKATMRAVFSIGTLRSVRFMTEKTQDANTTDGTNPATCTQESPSRTSEVEKVRTDVNTLPVLLHLGLPSYCPNVKTMQVDFTRDIKTEDIKSLQKLESVTALFLKAFRKPSYFFCSSVSLEDKSVLRDAMESLTNVEELYITDITIGDKEAVEILKAAHLHDLDKLVMRRCNTTEEGIQKELTEADQDWTGDPRYSVTHGTPDTKENGKGSRFKNYLQSTTHTHFDAHFDVIVRDGLMA